MSSRALLACPMMLHTPVPSHPIQPQLCLPLTPPQPDSRISQTRIQPLSALGGSGLAGMAPRYSLIRSKGGDISFHCRGQARSLQGDGNQKSLGETSAPCYSPIHVDMVSVAGLGYSQIESGKAPTVEGQCCEDSGGSCS